MRHLRLAAAILGIAGLALRMAEDVRLRRLGVKLAPVSDDKFVNTARSLNAFESSLARLALEVSANEDIRAFADHVLEKEGATTNEMIELMEINPDPSAHFKPIYHAWIEDLQRAKPADFDQMLVSVGQTVYQGAVSVFEAYVRDDATGPLKTYAARHIPRLQVRLSQLKALDLTPSQHIPTELMA